MMVCYWPEWIWMLIALTALVVGMWIGAEVIAKV